MIQTLSLPVRRITDAHDLLGESPCWHPQEQVLYWCDIPGHALNRLDPASGRSRRWQFDTDVACCAPMPDGRLLLAMRSGLWGFDPSTGQRELLAPPPYDPAQERFNDGKCDPQGRFWVGTIYEPRDAPHAALYCFDGRQLQRMAGDVTVSNGLAWPAGGRTMYWSDTKAHVIYALPLDPQTGAVGERRVLTRFEPRQEGQPLADYGGRPDGAAVDAEGCLWVAMFEGQRLVRIAPDGELLAQMPLPVRCPTMPCFGGPDGRTLYVTTASDKRPAQELAEQPWAGCVLALDVPVGGSPAAVFSPR